MSTCHCGEPVVFGFDGDNTHHRGMCEHCDAIRCDAYPGECNRPSRALSFNDTEAFLEWLAAQG